jgi:protein-tyrosine sulfotransferase
MAAKTPFIQRLSRTRLGDMGFWLRRAIRRNSISPSWFYDAPLDAAQLDRLQAVASAVRQHGGPAVVILHGVMPRSGTNYLAELLALHPDVVVHPLGIRELPLLALVPEARHWQEAFLEFYRGNETVFADLELFAYAISGLMRRIEHHYRDTRLVVLKVPHTRFISYFPAFFPKDRCIMLLRDGRHVVQSTIATWPLKPFGKSFADICQEWTYATHAALDYWQVCDTNVTSLQRYEDIVSAPHERMETLLDFLGLDPARYSFDRIKTLPVFGSSEVSKRNGEVVWEPVKVDGSFNPARRKIQWSPRQERLFASIAGPAMRRAGYE